MDHELIAVDVTIGAVEMIDALLALHGQHEGVAKPVVAGICARRAVRRLHAVDVDVLVVRIGRIPRAVGVERQRLAPELPGRAPIRRDRSDRRLLFIARAIVEQAFKDRAATANKTGDVILGVVNRERGTFDRFLLPRGEGYTPGKTKRLTWSRRDGGWGINPKWLIDSTKF
jgi:hypothetical protein